MVGAIYYVPYNIWYIIFMHRQGYLNKLNKFFQYNQISMKWDINGRNYCTGNSQHIDIKYFFIKYRVYRGDISFMYFTRRLMLEDYFAKPIQGYLFHKFRETIMERVSTYILLKGIVSYSIKGSVEIIFSGKQIPSKIFHRKIRFHW